MPRHLLCGQLAEVLAFPLRLSVGDPFAALPRVAEHQVLELAGRRALGRRFAGWIVFGAAELDAYGRKRAVGSVVRKILELRNEVGVRLAVHLVAVFLIEVRLCIFRDFIVERFTQRVRNILGLAKAAHHGVLRGGGGYADGAEKHKRGRKGDRAYHYKLFHQWSPSPSGKTDSMTFYFTDLSCW